MSGGVVPPASFGSASGGRRPRRETRKRSNAAHIVDLEQEVEIAKRTSVRSVSPTCRASARRFA